MNVANQLTILRISIVPFLVFFMYLDNFWTRIIALLLFTIAAVTDAYDGFIARQQKTVTTLGIFLDPIADKLLISAALISFVGSRELHIPAWMVIFIISREFIITGLRSMAATRSIIIPAMKTGKFKTTSQIVAIITLMVVLIVNSALWHYKAIRPPELLLRSGWSYALGWFLVKLPYWMMLRTTVFTILSGMSYMYAHKEIFRDKTG